MTVRVLVATAVEPEAAAVRAGLDGTSEGAPEAARTGSVPVDVRAVGVGPAAAAAGTARLLATAEAAGAPYSAVLSAGIAGGFPDRAAIGALVLATRSIAAELGAESPTGFLPLDELGFGDPVVPADRALLAALRAALPDAVTGAVLTLSTVTGTGATARALAGRYPDAVAEAMEGYGVATAAGQAGLPFAELRTISNLVGPRDRSAWRLDAAFRALTTAAPAIRRVGHAIPSAAPAAAPTGTARTAAPATGSPANASPSTGSSAPAETR
ncbi:futalosine hydrolase [Plantactinospora sp. KBS50]|nr:futalosine hydrolase [Plantactinospora sp. KBS50]